MTRTAQKLFVRALAATAILMLATRLGLGAAFEAIVGNAGGFIANALPWVALAVAAYAVFRTWSGLKPQLVLKGNSRKRQIIGYLIFSVVCALIWLYGMGVFGRLSNDYKAIRTILNTLYPFSAPLGVMLFLGAILLLVTGSIDDRSRIPGPAERLLGGNLSAKVAALPMMLTALGVFVGATLWTVYHSFTNSKLLPKSDLIGFDQYERLWSSSRWLISIENLVIYGVCSLIFSLVIGFMLAVLLDQKIRFENTFRSIFLFPFALSFIVTGLVWQWILTPEFGVQAIVRSLGFESFTFDPLYDADIVIYGILIAGLWQGTGLIMCLMLAGLRGIDEEIWKAARVDGIPAWKTYIFIIIPMMRPVFITTLVIIAAGIVKVYDLVVAQTSGGPGLASEVPAKYVYDYMFGGQNLAQGFAGSTMMLLSVLIVIIPWAYLEFKGKKTHG